MSSVYSGADFAPLSKTKSANLLAFIKTTLTSPEYDSAISRHLSLTSSLVIYFNLCVLVYLLFSDFHPLAGPCLSPFLSVQLYSHSYQAK